MSGVISYSSIAEIHNALVCKDHSPRDLFDYIEHNYREWEEQKTQDRIQGSESDYHNLAVEFSRQDCEPFAAAVATIGVGVYPMSTDLLADVIKYSQQIGDSASCQKGINRLKKINRKYWNWRTFVFVIDFLKDSLSSSSNSKKFETNLADAKQFIEEFKQYIPYDERAYVKDAELYQHEGNYSKTICVLEAGIEKIAVAPQCCMKLAGLYLELGKYDKVEEYARKGLLAATQDQPTVSLGYLYYLLALSMDADRIKRRQMGEPIDNGKIQSIMTAYQTADELFINEGRLTVSYRNTIKAKLIIIKMEEGLSGKTDICTSEAEKESSQFSLSTLQKLSELAESIQDN